MTFVERYSSALDKCSIVDPETEPFRSKYEAKKIFEELKTIDSIGSIPVDLREDFESLNLFNDDDNDKKYRKFVDLILDFHIASIENETEEKNSAEIRLRSILSTIDSVICHPLILNLALNVLNQLILIRTSYDQYAEAIELAQKAEEIYRKSSSSIRIRSFDEILGLESRQSDFEEIFTHTLFYLAQIYGKLEEKSQSARYCRMTLERQLKTPKFLPMDWATNCATLSQYYMTKHDYPTARHCLICADAMLKRVENAEFYAERHASFERCWIKYAVNLLSDSADRLLQSADRDVHPNEIVRSISSAEFQFELEDLPNPSINSAFVLDFSQARQIFLFAMEKIRSAKSFYVLDGFVTDHIEISQDQSQLYNKLIFFESKNDRKCKMHKRRIDLLSSLCQQISEEHYLTLIRQLLFELGETYSQLLDLKLDDSTKRNPIKIQRLTTKGIETFERFLRTMIDPKTKEFPPTFAEEFVRPVVLARFYLARFHSKSPENRREHVEHSLNEYRWIVDYVDRHPQTKDFVEQEFRISQEMKELLPLKLQQM